MSFSWNIDSVSWGQNFCTHGDSQMKTFIPCQETGASPIQARTLHQYLHYMPLSPPEFEHCALLYLQCCLDYWLSPRCQYFNRKQNETHFSLPEYYVPFAFGSASPGIQLMPKTGFRHVCHSISGTRFLIADIGRLHDKFREHESTFTNQVWVNQYSQQ